MSRTLFANSKAALVFAGMTIVGALVMVGTEDSGGVLDQTVGRFGQQREPIVEEAREVSEERTEMTEPLDPASGWGGTGGGVFGEYTEEPVAPEPEDEAAPVAPPVRSAPRAFEQTVPVGGPVVADAPGIVVPGEDDASDSAVSRATPVVTSRTLRAEPQ
jgi:hypothetical protein